MEQGNPNSLHLMEGCKRFHLPASGEGQCKKRMPMCNAFDRVEEILEHFRCGRGCAWLAGLGYPPRQPATATAPATVAPPAFLDGLSRWFCTIGFLYRFLYIFLYIFFFCFFWFILLVFYIYIYSFFFLFINKNKKRIYIKNVRKKQRKYIYISI